MSIISGTNSNSTIAFGDGTGSAGYQGMIAYLNGTGGDAMTFRTSAVERMRIDSSGKVGIGTTDPAYKFTVQGAATTEIVGIDVSTTGKPTIMFLDAKIEMDDSTTPTLPLNIMSRNPGNASYTSPITFWTGAGSSSRTEKMRITGDGKVGIGATNPLGKIHVWTDSAGGSVTYNTAVDELLLENSGNCGMTIMSGATGNGAIWFGKTGDNGKGRIDFDQNDGKMSFWTANTERLSIDNSGNVGINTNPTFSILNEGALELEAVGDQFPGLRIERSGGSSYTNKAFEILVTNTGSLNFYDATGGAARLLIDTSGNVGIGSDTPAHPLHVRADVNGNVVTKFENTNSSDPYGLFIDFTAAAPNNTSNYFIRGVDTDGSEFSIRADGQFYQHSDRRSKENIEDVESMLGKVNALKVKNYNRIGDVSKGLHIGVMAQDVEEIFPHLVLTDEAKDAVLDDDGNIKERATKERKGLYKIGLIFPLIKAFQELSAKVTALESA